jgi:hypothetical protein
MADEEEPTPMEEEVSRPCLPRKPYTDQRA